MASNFTRLTTSKLKGSTFFLIVESKSFIVSISPSFNESPNLSLPLRLMLGKIEAFSISKSDC